FGVVLVPAAWEVYPHAWDAVLTQSPAMRAATLDLEQPSKRLTSFLAGHGVTVVNLLPEFRVYASASAPLYLQGDGHWTAEGHRLAADLLAPRTLHMLGVGSDQPVAQARGQR